MEVLGSKAERLGEFRKASESQRGGEVRGGSGWERNRQLPVTGSPGGGRGGRLETG